MLEDLYNNEVAPSLIESLKCKNVMQVPKIVKVCLNVGIGKKTSSPKLIELIRGHLTSIAAQKAVLTYAKKSISGFSIRKKEVVGCRVTLRKKLMYVFLERLLYTALPREKDFQGFRASQFDGNGNFSFGIKEHVVFPEIDYESINDSFGFDVTIVTSASVDSDAQKLLGCLGFPFLS